MQGHPEMSAACAGPQRDQGTLAARRRDNLIHQGIATGLLVDLEPRLGDHLEAFCGCKPAIGHLFRDEP